MVKLYTLFFISNTFAKILNWQINQKLSNTLRLTFCYLKIFRFLHPLYHPKINRIYSKKCTKNKCVCFNKVIWLLTMKMRLKKKNRSHRYDINRHLPRHGHKYTECKVCLSIMMVLGIKQHLSNIWSSIHEKVKQYLGRVAYKKTCTVLLWKLWRRKIMWHHKDLNISTNFPPKFIQNPKVFSVPILQVTKYPMSDKFAIRFLKISLKILKNTDLNSVLRFKTGGFSWNFDAEKVHKTTNI